MKPRTTVMGLVALGSLARCPSPIWRAPPTRTQEDSARPVPKKIVITYVNQPGQPQFTAVLTGWDFAPRLPDLVFDFAPPTNADEIEFLSLANVNR